MALVTHNITDELKDALGVARASGRVTFRPYATSDARTDPATGDALLGTIEEDIEGMPSPYPLTAGAWRITIESTTKVRGRPEFSPIVTTMTLDRDYSWQEIVDGAVTPVPVTPTVLQEAQAAAAEAEMWASTAQGVQDTQVSTLVSDGSSATSAALSATFVPRSEAGSLGGAGGSTIAAPLDLPTYDGNPEATHPSVLKFDTEWNGYTYWMGFTPYPNAARENPSILASNDGETWVVPTGLTNPVVPISEATALGNDYWSDTALVMLDDTTMALYFRGYDEGVADRLYRKTSADGVTWSATTQVLTGAAISLLSPTIIREGSTFAMWSVNDSAANAVIERRTSADGLTWSAATTCTVTDHTPGYPTFWHTEVRKADDGLYWMLLNSEPAHPRLWWLTSADGLTWEFVGPAVDVSGDPWDAGGHYRSSFVQVGSNPTRFDVWLSGITDDNPTNAYVGNTWRIGLMRGHDPRSVLANVGRDAIMLRTGDLGTYNGTTLSVVGNQPTWTINEAGSGTYGVVASFLVPRGTTAVDIEAWIAAGGNPAQMRFSVRWLATQGIAGEFPAGSDTSIVATTATLSNVTKPISLGVLRLPTSARYVNLQIYRSPGDALDTATVAAYLRGLRIVPIR